MLSSDRTGAYRRNADLEQLLNELSALLQPAEDAAVQAFRAPRWPPLFIVGGPRCGSTLMMQFLAASGSFAYPSNLLSRFYATPYLGAKIQQLLTDPKFDYKGELFDVQDRIDYTSDLGKTRGALQPNEFWYFWRRFIPSGAGDQLTPEQETRFESEKFLKELAALEFAFDRPLAMKAILLEQNLPFLSSLFDSATFIYLKRHPLYRMQSLLECRRRFFGTENEWYSIKPPQYEQLKDLDPVEQVAGQVYFGDETVAAGLSRLPSERVLRIDYENFCRDPAALYRHLARALAQWNCRLGDYRGPRQFPTSNVPRCDARTQSRIVQAYRNVSGERLAFD